jgi:hypothetical protein
MCALLTVSIVLATQSAAEAPGQHKFVIGIPLTAILAIVAAKRGAKRFASRITSLGAQKVMRGALLALAAIVASGCESNRQKSSEAGKLALARKELSAAEWSARPPLIGLGRIACGTVGKGVAHIGLDSKTNPHDAAKTVTLSSACPWIKIDSVEVGPTHDGLQTLMVKLATSPSTPPDAYTNVPVTISVADSTGAAHAVALQVSWVAESLSTFFPKAVSLSVEMGELIGDASVTFNVSRQQSLKRATISSSVLAAELVKVQSTQDRDSYRCDLKLVDPMSRTAEEGFISVLGDADVLLFRVPYRLRVGK